MLDLATLRAAFSVVALTLAVLIYLITFRSTHSAYSAWWCTAIALFLTGSAAYLLDGSPLQQWANPLGNTLLVMGAVSVWAGARSLRTSGPRMWQLVLGPILAFAASAADNPASNYWSGDPVFLALMSLLIGLSCWELWRLAPDYTRIRRPMAWVSGFLAVFYLCRWVAFITGGPTSQVYRAFFGSEVTTLLTMMLLVAASFSMAALSTEQATKDLRARATQDGLTGLLNRTGFLDLAANEVRRLRRAGTTGSLILADLDHFKDVNDQHGHAAGDSVLQAFAAACTGAVRSTDLVGRYGGEEFIILLPGAGTDQAEAITGQISLSLQAMPAREDLRWPTVSYGITPIHAAGGLETMIASADAALYHAKSGGRDRAVRAD